MIVSCNNPGLGVTGFAYNHQFIASGGTFPYVFSYSGTLPFGTALSPQGILTGVVTVAGVFAFTITAVDGVGATASVDCTITVACSDSGGRG